jgi:ABC-type dipeptide/oligopeptide/nickel transport system permease component
MLRYTLRRTGQMVVVVLGVVTLVFFLLRIASGDPARMMNPPGQQEEIVQLTREKIGTDRPLMVQYWDYLFGCCRGSRHIVPWRESRPR